MCVAFEGIILGVCVVRSAPRHHSQEEHSLLLPPRCPETETNHPHKKISFRIQRAQLFFVSHAIKSTPLHCRSCSSLTAMGAKPAKEFAIRVSIIVISLVPALAVLSINTILDVIEGRNGFWTIFTMGSLYLLALLIFLSIYIAHLMPVDSPNRARLGLPVWVILTSILLLIAYRTSAVLSPGFAWAVWVLALSFSGFFYWVVFLERPRDDSSGCAGDCAQDKPGHTQKSPPTVVDDV